MKALPHREVGSAIRKARTADEMPVARLAFEFLVLTAARWGEVRWAEWSEIDLSHRVWTVPATRMKAKREHRVPLCRFADRRRTATGANGDEVPEAVPAVRRADAGTEVQGVKGGWSTPLPVRNAKLASADPSSRGSAVFSRRPGKHPHGLTVISLTNCRVIPLGRTDMRCRYWCVPDRKRRFGQLNRAA